MGSATRRRKPDGDTGPAEHDHRVSGFEGSNNNACAIDEARGHNINSSGQRDHDDIDRTNHHDDTTDTSTDDRGYTPDEHAGNGPGNDIPHEPCNDHDP